MVKANGSALIKDAGAAKICWEYSVNGGAWSTPTCAWCSDKNRHPVQ